MLVPELNMGQLRMLIRGKFLVDAEGLNKVQGKPFPVQEIVARSASNWPVEQRSAVNADTVAAGLAAQ